MVECVEELHTELGLDAFRDLEVLVDTDVPVVVTGTGADTSACVANLAELVAVHTIHAGVQPLGCITRISAARLTGNTIRTLASGWSTVADTHRITDGTSSPKAGKRCDRGSAGHGDDWAYFPSAKRRLHQSALTGQEREMVNHVGGEDLRMVQDIRTPIGLEVVGVHILLGRINSLRVSQQLREGVRRLYAGVVAEARCESTLQRVIRRAAGVLVISDGVIEDGRAKWMKSLSGRRYLRVI